MASQGSLEVDARVVQIPSLQPSRGADHPSSLPGRPRACPVRPRGQASGRALLGRIDWRRMCSLITHATRGAPSPVGWGITGGEGLGSPFIDYVVEVTITPGTQAVGRRIRYYGDAARDQRGRARQDLTMQVHEHAPFDRTGGLSHRVTRCDRFDAQCRTPEDEAKRSSRARFDANSCRPSAGTS
jgi:hypothetical protein